MITDINHDSKTQFVNQVTNTAKQLVHQLRNPRELNDEINLIFLDREEPATEDQSIHFCEYIIKTFIKKIDEIITVREIDEAELKLRLINTPFPLDTLADALKLANTTQYIHRFPSR